MATSMDNSKKEVWVSFIDPLDRDRIFESILWWSSETNRTLIVHETNGVYASAWLKISGFADIQHAYGLGFIIGVKTRAL